MMVLPRRLRAAVSCSLVFAGISSVGCARHASVADCTALLDRYVELLVHEQDPKASDIEMARQKELTRDKASHDSAFTSCPKEVTAGAARCAMAAGNVDEFEKCLE